MRHLLQTRSGSAVTHSYIIPSPFIDSGDESVLLEKNLLSKPLANGTSETWKWLL
jgi:hypothetical protein